MEMKKSGLGGVACDLCRAFAMISGDALPEGWRAVKLITGDLDICPSCSNRAPRLIPGQRAREIESTEIVGGPHDGYVRPPRVGTVRLVVGSFAEMDWDPGTDHTGLPEDPVLRWSWDVVALDWLEPLP